MSITCLLSTCSVHPDDLGPVAHVPPPHLGVLVLGVPVEEELVPVGGEPCHDSAMMTAQGVHLYAESSLSSGCLTVTQLKWVLAAALQKLGLRVLGRHF